MRIAVVGASGFVGNACMRAALAAGHEAVAVMASPTSALRFASQGWKMVVGRLEDSARWVPELGAVDAVVNAAYGGVQDLTKGPGLLLDALHKSKVPTLVHVGSAAVYGLDMPTGPNPEDAKPDAMSTYRRAKITADEALLSQKGPTAVAIVRPHLVYGAESGRVRRLAEAIRTGRIWFPEEAFAKTNFVYGDNLGWQLVKLVEVGFGQRAVFCARDAGMSWVDLAKSVAGALKVPLDAAVRSTRQEWLSRDAATAKRVSFRAPVEPESVVGWVKSLRVFQENVTAARDFAGRVGVLQRKERQFLEGQVADARRATAPFKGADVGLHVEMSGRGLLDCSRLDRLIGTPPHDAARALADVGAWVAWLYNPPLLPLPCSTSAT